MTVVAKHMPGDYDIQYTSPWAGANYLPYAHSKSSSRPVSYATGLPGLMADLQNKKHVNAGEQPVGKEDMA